MISRLLLNISIFTCLSVVTGVKSVVTTPELMTWLGRLGNLQKEQPFLPVPGCARFYATIPPTIHKMLPSLGLSLTFRLTQPVDGPVPLKRLYFNRSPMSSSWRISAPVDSLEDSSCDLHCAFQEMPKHDFFWDGRERHIYSNLHNLHPLISTTKLNFQKWSLAQLCRIIFLQASFWWGQLPAGANQNASLVNTTYHFP